MFTYTAMGTCVLVLTLGAILAIILVIQKEKTGKGVGTGVLAAFIGMLLGAGGAAAIVQIKDYELVKVHRPDAAEDGGDTGSAGGGGGMGGGMGMGGGGGGMGMGGGGMMGGMMGGMGGGGPDHKRQLTSAVRKLDLMTSGIALELTPEQTDKLAAIMQRLESSKTMTDDEAEAIEKEINEVFTEEQLAKQEAVGLPRRRGGRGGGGGFGGGGGGGDQAEDENPFTQEANAEALSNLVARLGGGSAAVGETSPAETTPAPEETTKEDAAPAASGKSE